MAEQQGTLAKLQDWFNRANQVNVPRTPYTAAIVDQTYKNPVSQFIDDKVGAPVRQWGQQTKGALNTAFPKATLLLGGDDEMARRGKIADQYAPPNAPPVSSRPAAYPMSELSATPTSAPKAGLVIPQNVGVPTADLSRNVSPDRYDPAVQARGQRNAFEQPLMEKGYQPTSFDGVMYKTQGGQTEYQHPKGSVTFQGGALGAPGRQGGGTLSVLSGRTPEEQAAITERVKSIDSQTAAMRGLRNANRLSQGGVTVEQEEQMNAMQRQMGQLAPQPNMSRLDEQQSALMQQLKDAQGIKGFGKRRQREDAMDAAKIGLAQLEAQRQAVGQQYGQQLGLAQNLIQNQTAQEAAQAKALQDQQQWMADYGLKQQANEIAGQKNEADVANTGQQRAMDQQRLALEQAKAQREGRIQPPDQKYMEQFYLKNEIDPANPTKKFLPDQFTSITGIQPLPEKDPEQGKVYLSPQDGMGVIFGPNGPMKMGLEQAILFDRMIKRGQGLY